MIYNLLGLDCSEAATFEKFKCLVLVYLKDKIFDLAK